MEQTYEIRVERSRLALMLRFLGWIFTGTVITTCIGRFAVVYKAFGKYGVTCN